MLKKHVTICNKRGLHARAAAKFSCLCEDFSSHIQVCYGSISVSGRSIMGLMMLGASCGVSIEIICQGCDEKEALDALLNLVDQGFNEN